MTSFEAVIHSSTKDSHFLTNIHNFMENQKHNATQNKLKLVWGNLKNISQRVTEIVTVNICQVWNKITLLGI